MHIPKEFLPSEKNMFFSEKASHRGLLKTITSLISTYWTASLRQQANSKNQNTKGEKNILQKDALNPKQTLYTKEGTKLSMSFQMIDAQTLKVLYVNIKNPGENIE